MVICRARLDRAQRDLPERDAAPPRAKVARVEGSVDGDDAADIVGGQGIAHRGAAEGASVADEDAECVMASIVGMAEERISRNAMKYV